MNDADLATQAVWLLAVDPQGLGGLCLRGPAGPARDQVLASLRRVWPAEAPWRRLPLQIDDEALYGGLDLGLSLAAGRPVARAGLLAEVDQGLLLLPMAERIEPGLAARLAAALEPNASKEAASRFCLVALDEGQSPEEQLPAGLLERLALIASPAAIDAAQHLSFLNEPAEPGQAPPFDLAAARQRLAEMPYDEAIVQALCGTAAALGLVSLRPPWQAWRAACAAAAIAGRDQVSQADAELGARLVLAPRARALPQAAADEEEGEEEQAETAAQAEPQSEPPNQAEAAQPPEPEASDAAQPPDAPAPASSPQDEQRSPSPVQMQDQMTAAAQAAIPADLLASLAGGSFQGSGGAGGRRGASGRPAQSGRPLSSRRGSLRSGSRLDLLATMRAAIPWQRLRLAEREQRGLEPAVAPARLLLRRDDFHIKRYRRPNETTTVFVVDASGSQALSRLSEAKGAVELLLADCYVRRDRVALIAFRGEGAEVLLAPTRSLVRARRSLSGLPGGGGTPLAAGIEAAGRLALSVQSQREGSQALLVFLTDARANIARDGSPGRPQAMQDALAAAAQLRAAGLRSVLIDSSPRPQPQAMLLAQAMAARYVPLPQGQAADVHGAVVGSR